MFYLNKEEISLLVILQFKLGRKEILSNRRLNRPSNDLYTIQATLGTAYSICLASPLLLIVLSRSQKCLIVKGRITMIYSCSLRLVVAHCIIAVRTDFVKVSALINQNLPSVCRTQVVKYIRYHYTSITLIYVVIINLRIIVYIAEVYGTSARAPKK